MKEPTKEQQLRALREEKHEKRKRASKGTFDRTAYQRELMRKRRAKK
jgi:hypothetical protein